MPAIDWTYYRENVRKEMVSWVDEFEKKYERLDNMFANRHSLIDHSKYFGESEELTKCVEHEIEKYKEESNKRIKELEKKMEHLKMMKSYNEMTMEEFCFSHPNEAPDFINKPTFWPHTPEEQKPGPAEEVLPEAGNEPKSKGDTPDPKDGKPKKTPPTPPTGAAPAKNDKPQPKKEKKEVKTSDESTSEVKKTEAKTSEVKKAEAQGSEPKAATGKDESKTESQAVDYALELASQGIEFAKTAVERTIALFRSVLLKAGEKRKQVAETAAAERLKKQTVEPPKKLIEPDEDDISKREAQFNICNKTIIQGDDTAKADVKPHHVDLEITSDTPEEKDAKKRKIKEKENEKKCMPRQKSEAEEEEKDECQEKKRVCVSPVEKTEETVKPCPKPKEKIDPCSRKPPTSDASTVGAPTMFNVSTQNTVCGTDALGLEDTKSVIGKHNVNVSNESNDDTGDQSKSGQEMPVITSTKTLQSDIYKSSKDISDQARSGQLNAESVAKFVFEMASSTAALLSEAKNIIEKVEQDKSGLDLEAAYQEAESKVTAALNHAYMALDSAKGLAKQSGIGDNDAVALIEKHAMLAQLLAYRAIAMKKEIAKLLADLRGK